MPAAGESPQPATASCAREPEFEVVATNPARASRPTRSLTVKSGALGKHREGAPDRRSGKQRFVVFSRKTERLDPPVDHYHGPLDDRRLVDHQRDRTVSGSA